jgi:ATP-dependent protease ClpP protease subunit
MVNNLPFQFRSQILCGFMLAFRKTFKDLRWRSFWLAAFAFWVLPFPAPSRAADITVAKVEGVNVINIKGPIIVGDDDKFTSVAGTYAGRFNQPTLVVLNSPGGQVVPGLSIGETIRASGFTTGVANGMECTSICAMIWLAGTERYIGSTAKVGFHAAYIGLGDDAKESGQANAIVGAYLSKLGYSYKAIAFATSAGPAEIRWLHPEDAGEIGIRIRVIPDSEPDRSKPKSAEPAGDGAPAERQAKNLVLSYYAIWSNSGTDVEALGHYYGDSALFYGTRQFREQIMTEKRKFSARWPVRHYTVRVPTLFAQCADICSVTGVVEWDVSSPERGAHSIGSANFVLKVALDSSGSDGIVLSENGSVLSAHNDTLPTAQASTDTSSTHAYLSGRQARVDYEAWFNSIPPGDYQQGVTFWAANRSLKIPPSCTQPGRSAEWQNGCMGARQRLITSDLRRRTEADFKAGWNSL